MTEKRLNILVISRLFDPLHTLAKVHTTTCTVAHNKVGSFQFGFLLGRTQEKMLQIKILL